MPDCRIERDTLGDIDVENCKYWGAQTQRALVNFGKIGTNLMPFEVISALILIKKAAAKVNMKLNVIQKEIADLIIKAADKLLSENYRDQFPLTIWQSGSGTQSNMNVNEVISNIAIEIAGGQLGTKIPVHPNDHVNCSQSSNDTFPTAMSVAVVDKVYKLLIPSLTKLHYEVNRKAIEFTNIKKIGRTHMQDAVPMTVGEEFSGYATQIEFAIERIKREIIQLMEIPQGGTAVGTGLNAPNGFDKLIVEEISYLSGYNFVNARNKFEAISTSDSFVGFSSVLNVIAVSLYKIANDIRILSSGPRAGIGELKLPINEPGSSIMAGKVNPTQCEVLTMVCAQIMGNSATIAFAGSQSQLQLNTYRPIIIYNLLQSIDLLSCAAVNFAEYCVSGINVNTQRLKKNLDESVMISTYLNLHIGYDKAAKISAKALQDGISIKEAAIKTGLVTPEEFDEWVGII